MHAICENGEYFATLVDSEANDQDTVFRLGSALVLDPPAEQAQDVLQDTQDENVYYFYEVYRDEVALEAHRAAPHYAVWRAAADTLDGPPQATRCQTVFPAAAEYWTRNK